MDLHRQGASTSQVHRPVTFRIQYTSGAFAAPSGEKLRIGERGKKVNVSFSEQALARIRRKGGKAVLDLVCMST